MLLEAAFLSFLIEALVSKSHRVGDSKDSNLKSYTTTMGKPNRHDTHKENSDKRLFLLLLVYQRKVIVLLLWSINKLLWNISIYENIILLLTSSFPKVIPLGSWSC